MARPLAAITRARASLAALRDRRRARRLEKLEKSLAQHAPDGWHAGSPGQEGQAMTRIDPPSGF